MMMITTQTLTRQCWYILEDSSKAEISMAKFSQSDSERSILYAIMYVLEMRNVCDNRVRPATLHTAVDLATIEAERIKSHQRIKQRLKMPIGILR